MLTDSSLATEAVDSNNINDSEVTTSAGLNRPYLWAAVPAAALLAVSIALSSAPLPQPIGSPSATSPSSADSTSSITPSTNTDLLVPASETLVVSQQPTAGSVLLQGRMQVPAGIAVVAPSGGQVAQIAVRPGQAIQAGQPVLSLSTGAVSRRSYLAPAENRQSSAEQAQVAAVRQQREWQQRVQSAHDRLRQAQERVQSAQERVAQARELVRRLQNGEAVNSEAASTPAPRPRVASYNAQANARLRREIVARSQKMQTQADALVREAAVAKRSANAAEAVALNKQEQWQDAQRAAANIQTSAATSEGTASDNGAAKKAALARAETLRLEARSAAARASDARQQAETLDTRAASLRQQANDTAREAVASLQKLKVFDEEATNVREMPRVARNTTGNKMSVSQAVGVARTALEESKNAIADAERIRREVESYERPVERTRERFDAATQRLNTTQEQVWSAAEAARPNVTTVQAPTNGIVMWVTDLAREVRAGDQIAGIGRADRMEVMLRDTSGAWKNTRPDSMILALVQDQKAVNLHPTATRSTPANSARGVPTLARVLEVKAPQKPGAPAWIRVAIHNPRREGAQSRPNDYGMAGRTFVPDTPVVCSLAQPGQGTAIAIPSAAIRRNEDGKQYVAVLTPASDVATDGLAGLCRIEWREVKVGRNYGLQNLILSGLQAGERIALRPEAMETFLLTHGASATLRVEQA